MTLVNTGLGEFSRIVSKIRNAVIVALLCLIPTWVWVGFQVFSWPGRKIHNFFVPITGGGFKFLLVLQLVLVGLVAYSIFMGRKCEGIERLNS